MFLNSHPYKWNQVNDLFYGRSQLRSELVNKLRNGQSFGITGGRKIGKTTLLRKVEDDLLKGVEQWEKGGLLVIPVYVDTLAFPPPLTSENIFNIILQKIYALMQGYLHKQQFPLLSNQPFHPFAGDLARLLGQIRNHRPQIIILLDEVEPILARDWGSSFFSNWRSFLHNEPSISPFISAVFTGAEEMLHLAHDIGSPLGNVLTWRELMAFTYEDTKLLVTEPVHYPFSDGFIQKVYLETGGHPFLIQYVMAHVCERDLDFAFTSIDEAVGTFLDCEHDKFAGWWGKIPSSSQQIYGYLAYAGKPIAYQDLVQAFHSVDVMRDLNVLRHTGIVRYSPEVDSYATSGDMFIRWFRKFARLDVTEDLAEQVDRLLKDVERNLRQLLKKHLEQKYTCAWPISYIGQIRTKTRDGEVSLLDAWCKKAGRAPGDLGAEDALYYAEFGELFNIISREWQDLRIYFTFTKDPSKEKVFFDERKDCLVAVRNALRHVRENTVDASTLLKAQAFCVEIVDRLDNLDCENW